MVTDDVPNDLLREARERLFGTQQALADAANQHLPPAYVMSANYISKLECGVIARPGPIRRTALVEVTGAANEAALGFVKRSKRTTVPAPRRSHLTGADSAHLVDLETSVGLSKPYSPERVPERLSEVLIEQSVTTRDPDYLIGEWNSFSRLTSMLAQQRQAVSPSALLGLIEAHRDCLSTLYRKAGRSPLRADIGAMLAEASIVASRLWSAQGNDALALAHCAYARELGDRLGNSRISATARIFESNLHSHAATLIEADGDIMIGLRLLDEAAHTAGDLGPAARARIAAEQAQAFAALGLSREVTAALHRAEYEVDKLSPADCVGLYSDWNSARLPVYAGTCHLLLGQPEKAVDLLEMAMSTWQNDHANVNVALAASVDLASAYAAVGELEQSCALLGDTYDRLRSGGNRRGIARAERARERLSRWRAEPAVLALDERMAG